MELKDALPIVKALADGLDPYTGEVFPEDSPYQNPQTVRALNAVLRVAYIPSTKNEDAPKQAGNPWSDEEDQHLIEAFKMEQTTKDLAEYHGRTEGAIRSRLRKLNLIE